METLGGEIERQTNEVDLEIVGKGIRWNHSLTVYQVLVKKTLPTALNALVNTELDISGWTHFLGLEAPNHTNDQASVEVLIGLDTPEALQPLEIRAGRTGDPFAVRTRLGWTINGPVGYPGLKEVVACSLELPKRQLSRLESQVKQFWELETQAESTRENEDVALSIEDKRVLSLWTTTIRVVGGHYQLPIPFRKDRPKLPDNRGMAEGRLMSLKGRLLKNSILCARYQEEMQLMMDKHYAEVVPEAEINSNPDYTWYLPHHPVLSPNKPDKVRIVFDCAAIHDSTSLNKQVLQGPDLTNKLIGILLRFRLGQVAITADIEAMFYQIKVSTQHRDALRFLWWSEGDLSQRPQHYRMTVHPFGGVWSPSCAAFALQQALIGHKGDCTEIRKKAARNFYVDDLLLSVDSPKDASVLVQQIQDLLAQRGFRLTKWMSNSKEVITSIPVIERHSEMRDLDLRHEDLPTERTLGVKWDLQSDQFAMHVNVRSKPATRRGVLSIVSSVFDPLGFVSPFTIRGKMIIQDEVKRQKDWDEPLTEDNRREWEKWQLELRELNNFRIPRCFRKGVVGPSNVQLHHFCDASQRAYGMVSYLRIVDELGVQCAFVIGKSKLAPTKQQTIPRLELCAAALAAKVNQYLLTELDLQVDRSTFWTDSTLVLQYITNTERRFRVFVANRVTIIRNLSQPDQWRYVNSELNPADDASRGLTAKELNVRTRWLTGPEFLLLGEQHWPKQDKIEENIRNDSEVLSCSTLITPEPETTDDTNTSLRQLWTHYSSWYKLVKAVGWLLRAFKCLKERDHYTHEPHLTVSELRRARTIILRQVQLETYHEEVVTLLRKENIVRRSDVYKLEPWLDEDGILRVGGRLLQAPIRGESKEPVLLPKDHPVTELILRDVHQTEAGHSGREHTLAVLRQKYWVPRCRRMIDKMLKACFLCRRNNWRLKYQRQAPLPKDRVTPGGAPFASSGVDCFGPFLVKQGRKQFKRWGCIFTCAATRAVHLEVLASLDTDALINAVVRFSARRGVPKHIRSDNGTNMVGANREVQAALRSWRDDERFHEAFLRRQIEWSFNPPTASHMGGVWERQIRTVRKVLRAIAGAQVLDDERLQTLFCEAEAVINSRPITQTSESIHDLEALTPDHLLRVGEHGSLPIGGLLNENCYRRRWKHVQFLADQFWKRWVKEYLPTLRQRSHNIQPYRNFQKGDLVLITDETLPRNQWKLGRIVFAKAGDDGLVRQVKVRTAHKVYARPVNKICFLEGLDPL